MATSSRTGCASKRPLGCAAAGSAGCTSPPPLWAFHWLADLILWGSKSLLPRQLLLRTGAPVLGVCGSLVAAFPSSVFGPSLRPAVYFPCVRRHKECSLQGCASRKPWRFSACTLCLSLSRVQPAAFGRRALCETCPCDGHRAVLKKS